MQACKSLSRSYIGKIPKETTEEDIASMFSTIPLECTSITVSSRPLSRSIAATVHDSNHAAQVMRHQDTQNAKNAFATFATREDLVLALGMHNFIPYDGAQPMVVAPASAPPAARGDARQDRRGGSGGGFFDRDRFGGSDSGRDWSDVRREQPSGSWAC
jgi:RNA recognition motif-containing protein